MTRMEIKSGEIGLVRLFAIDPDTARPLRSSEPDHEADCDAPPWPLREALGASHRDADFIELFDRADREGGGLVEYMIKGRGSPEQDLAADRARLDSLRGQVLIVLSSALGG